MAQTSTNQFFNMDVSKMMADFRLPGVDVDTLVAAQRKNIEAVTAANQLALEGAQAVFRRQSEILRQAIEQTSAMVTELLAAGTPEAKIAKQAELLKVAFERTLANVHEVSEIIAKSNGEAAAVINKRVSAGLDEFKNSVGKARKH